MRILRERSQQASVLVIVFGLALLLAIEIYIVSAYSTGNVRMAGRMTSHRRAVYVGDSAFCGILARMRSGPWEARWFRNGAAVESGTPLHGGRIDTFVVDAVGETRAADVWIRTSFEETVLAMFWRVRFQDESLDLRNLVAPEFFTFLPPQSPAPTQAAGDPTLASASRLIAEQRANRSVALFLTDQVAAVPDFRNMAAVLGLVPAGRVADLRPGGGSQASYLRQIASAPRIPAPPPPPATTPSPLASRFTTPLDLPGVMAALFADLGLPPAQSPGPAHFADPALAASAFTAASQLAPGSVRDPRWETRIEHIKIYVIELAKKSSGSGCSICHQALDGLMTYLAEVSRLEATRAGRTPPSPEDVDPFPYDPSGYSNALTKYREWWIR